MSSDASNCRAAKLAKNRRRVLLPLGEGGPEGRMRAKIDAFPNPHPALRATLSRRERDTPRHDAHAECGPQWSWTNPRFTGCPADGVMNVLQLCDRLRVEQEWTRITQ